MENEIMVSICCLAYNHSKYIRQCLDGFVNQKTNFKFEVLIHDDASTDGTQDIIKEYEEQYPDIIKPIYQTENQYSKGVKITRTYQYPRAKGKYIAYCEGDDFWSDMNKLQKQFDIMEKNPDCAASIHKVSDISDNSVSLNTFHPRFELSDGIVKAEEFISIICNSVGLPFQLSSFFIRSEILLNSIKNTPPYMQVGAMGDVTLNLLLAACGNIYYINDSMSCYRNFSQGSWTAKIFSNVDLIIKSHKTVIKCFELYNECTNYIFEQSLIKKIIDEEFSVYLLEKNYKACLNRKYKEQFRLLNKKEKLNILLSVLFPHFMNYYRTRGKKE